MNKFASLAQCLKVSRHGQPRLIALGRAFAMARETIASSSRGSVD